MFFAGMVRIHLPMPLNTIIPWAASSRKIKFWYSRMVMMREPFDEARCYTFIYAHYRCFEVNLFEAPIGGVEYNESVIARGANQVRGNGEGGVYFLPAHVVGHGRREIYVFLAAAVIGKDTGSVAGIEHGGQHGLYRCVRALRVAVGIYLLYGAAGVYQVELARAVNGGVAYGAWYGQLYKLGELGVYKQRQGYEYYDYTGAYHAQALNSFSSTCAPSYTA